MKKNIYAYTLAGLLGVAALTACSGDKLDTAPTDSMSGTTLLGDATSALIPLNGIYRSMYTAGWSTTGNTHQCFGISAYTLAADVMGDDMIMGDVGSGWFWYDAAYNVKARYTRSSWRSYDLWNAYYTWISNANYILAAANTMSGSQSDINYVIGQAYAIRAYSYFMLEQWFSRTYKGHEQEAGVPIYTEPTFAGTTGQPRSTNAEVYARIDADIDSACARLQGTTQQHSSHIGYAVAQGIRARIALVEENWQKAKEAAHLAIDHSGKQVLPVASFAGLNDADAANVMWGAEIISDQAGMYASLFAHMDTVVAYGQSAPKQITVSLYDKIPATDARKAWWDPASQYSTGGYEQKKFAFSNPTTWEGDYVWMRIEEMYLTAAEAECRLGEETEARADLMAVMSQRDASYSCASKSGTALPTVTSASTGSLLEEIILQRRIELWGEDGRIFEIRRLHQGFRRDAADGWPSGLLLTTRPTDNPESYMWVITIPQAEFDGNVNMDGSKNQNPTGDL